MYEAYSSSEKFVCGRGQRTLRGATRIVLGTIWMLATGVATTAGMSVRADDGIDSSPASGSVLRIARQADPDREAAPAEAQPELLPPPKAPAKLAPENAVEKIPPTKSEASVPRGAVADGAGDSVDPGIRPIGSLTINIAPPAARDDQVLQLALPPDAARQYFLQQPPLPPSSLAYSPWMMDNSYSPPLNFCYRPLLFEEVNLERYGHCWGLLQPAVSTAKFYGNVALLPYRLIAQHPCQCTYHDHHFRPGGPAPREIQVPKLPFSHLTN